ncbi:MAG TPA: hypothetical protein VGE44_09730 [Daejeonella sp.]|uniref:hypothetical protein n=1 Tax=Daejeonella sp. TaxID=2805397 RepID=UPI002EDA6751
MSKSTTSFFTPFLLAIPAKAGISLSISPDLSFPRKWEPPTYHPIKSDPSKDRTSQQLNNEIGLSPA